MNISDYQLRWDENELNKFTRNNFKGFTVDENTIVFLTSIGLPYTAAPFVSFDRNELKTIAQVYSTGKEIDNFLIEIGSDGAGDPICIDLQNNCKIVILDHEDNFAPSFVNTSVRELFAFLTLYKEFAEKLILLHGDFAFLDSKFTDDELNDLLKELRLVDSHALASDQTFWSREIETLKANRGGQ